MKVIEKTENRLLVRHMPWLLGGAAFLIGAGALAAGVRSFGEGGEIGGPVFITALGIGVLAFGWWFAPVVELDFDREAGTLRFSELRLRRSRSRVFPLTPEVRVAVEADHSDGARLTRLTLKTGAETVPLERGYGSGDRNAIEAEINDWLGGAPARPAPRKVETQAQAVRRRR